MKIFFFRRDLVMIMNLNVQITVANAFKMHGSVIKWTNVLMLVTNPPNCVKYVFLITKIFNGICILFCDIQLTKIDTVIHNTKLYTPHLYL